MSKKSAAPVMRECPKCGPKPDTSDNFYPPRADGRTSKVCRACARAAATASDAKKPRASGDVELTERIKKHGETLAQFGTPMERECVSSLLRNGSVLAAAAALQLEPRALRAHLNEIERRAAARGWAPGSDMTKIAPENFRVKGVSSYYDRDGALVGQWVKTSREADDKYAAMLDAMSGISDAFKGKADPVSSPTNFEDDTMCVYPMGDPHLGMYAWAQETGAHFDIDIAERNLVAAVDHLVDLAPPSRRGLLIDLGDFFHADSSAGTTTAGTRVDVDTRWPKVLRAGIRTVRRCIDRMLLKHEIVDAIIEIGNHDAHSAIMLAICLSLYYEREPRVQIDTSPGKFHWRRFGKCLIGVTHGDTAKAADLPGVMACDRAQDWGETLHRYWYCGHVHHDRLREYPGVTVESFRTLAPKDAWHAGQGYRSGQDMKLDVLDREHGRIMRHVVGINQIQSTADRDAD